MNLSLHKNIWKIFANKSVHRQCVSISHTTRVFTRTVSDCRIENEKERNVAHENPPNKSSSLHFQNAWPPAERIEIERDMIIVEDFISEAEELTLIAEAEKSIKRMRYEYDHWDNAIHGYREMEKVDWLPENRILFDRVRKFAFVSDVMPHVHILDLAKDGIIKPHVDSSRYCGTTIAGLSLLTDCIMRLRRVDEMKYVQAKMGEDNKDAINNSNKSTAAIEYDYFVDCLLKRRSLYVMKNVARYNFTHEVLATNSEFKGVNVEKERRISIICRNQP